MGKTVTGVLIGLAIVAVLFGLLFTLIGFKAQAYTFDLVGFIVFGPGLMAPGIAYIAWVEHKAVESRIAAQAMKPMDVVFFEDPPAPPAT